MMNSDGASLWMPSISLVCLKRSVTHSSHEAARSAWGIEVVSSCSFPSSVVFLTMGVGEGVGDGLTRTRERKPKGEARKRGVLDAQRERRAESSHGCLAATIATADMDAR